MAFGILQTSEEIVVIAMSETFDKFLMSCISPNTYELSAGQLTGTPFSFQKITGMPIPAWNKNTGIHFCPIPAPLHL